MDSNPVNESHPEPGSTEDNEQNVEMPSHTDESLPAISSSAPATPKADKTPKSMNHSYLTFVFNSVLQNNIF